VTVLAAPSDRRIRTRPARTIAAVAVASLLLGGLTSFAQGVLPDVLRPFSNSASGWTLLTALLVWACGERVRVSAVLGVVGFLGLVLGYVVVSTVRGSADAEPLFTVAAIVVGPFVGVAAAWLRRRGLPAALGAGLLCGIGLGEAVYGLTVVVASTGWFCWSVIALLAGVLLATVLATRVAGWRHRLAGLGLAAILAAAFGVVYQLV
jgi:Family of unknown function (DUF6518)